MKNIIIAALFSLFLIGCSNTRVDDGTNFYNDFSKYSSDDGTNYHSSDKSNSTVENNEKAPEKTVAKNTDKSNNKAKPKTTSSKTSEKTTKKTTTQEKKQTTTQTAKVSPKPTPSTNSKEKPKSSTKTNTVKSSDPELFYPVSSINISKDFDHDTNPGIDFKTSIGTKVKPSAPGVVIFSGKKNSMGKTLIIYHNSGYLSIYYNLKEIYVNKKDFIKDINTSVALSDTNFHYELRQQTESGIKVLDPKKVLKKRRK